jgi:hypothetical protein
VCDAIRAETGNDAVEYWHLGAAIHAPLAPDTRSHTPELWLHEPASLLSSLSAALPSDV